MVMWLFRNWQTTKLDTQFHSWKIKEKWRPNPCEMNERRQVYATTTTTTTVYMTDAFHIFIWHVFITKKKFVIRLDTIRWIFQLFWPQLKEKSTIWFCIASHFVSFFGELCVDMSRLNFDDRSHSVCLKTRFLHLLLSFHLYFIRAFYHWECEKSNKIMSDAICDHTRTHDKTKNTKKKNCVFFSARSRIERAIIQICFFFQCHFVRSMQFVSLSMTLGFLRMCLCSCTQAKN